MIGNSSVQEHGFTLSGRSFQCPPRVESSRPDDNSCYDEAVQTKSRRAASTSNAWYGSEAPGSRFTFVNLPLSGRYR